MDGSLEHLVRNQLLLREVNERTAEMATPSARAEFVCECSRDDCEENLELPPGVYASVRSSKNLFVILPGHELTEVDRVVRAASRYSLVEKTKHIDLVLSLGRIRPIEGG